MANRLRKKQVIFWVTDEEKEKIKEKAESLKLSISTYIRKMILEGIIVNKDYNRLYYELNKIGVNINQIAKKVNESNTISDRDFDELKEEVQNIFDLYYEEFVGD